jgi:hypothetical protein
MCNNCVQLVKMEGLHRGNNHKSSHSLVCTEQALCAKAPVFTQFFHTQAHVFPQPKTRFLNLLQTTFSPLSTPPTNTITIHINK